MAIILAKYLTAVAKKVYAYRDTQSAIGGVKALAVTGIWLVPGSVSSLS